MKQFRLDSSPIVYYVGGNNHKEWILFLHAAFVSHKMFQSQFAYFESRYNILAVDYRPWKINRDEKRRQYRKNVGMDF